MAASHGSIVYSEHASCVLQTGEFVKIQHIKGQGYIFRIVNTCRYDDLPADVQVYWKKDGGRGSNIVTSSGSLQDTFLYLLVSHSAPIVRAQDKGARIFGPPTLPWLFWRRGAWSGTAITWSRRRPRNCLLNRSKSTTATTALRARDKASGSSPTPSRTTRRRTSRPASGTTWPKSTSSSPPRRHDRSPQPKSCTA